MSKIFQITPGDRFGKLVISHEAARLTLPCGQKARRFVCRCDCGKVKEVLLGHLRRGKIKSCGCIHGESHAMSYTTLYYVWNSMRQRCSKDYNQAARNYKDRGITVCVEWDNSFIAFKDWCLANGWKKGLQLDRINNDGNYEPSNCRFVTPKQNGLNRRGTVMVTYRGITQPLMSLMESLGRKENYSMVRSRINIGWDLEKALNTPSLLPRTGKGRSEKQKQWVFKNRERLNNKARERKMPHLDRG